MNLGNGNVLLLRAASAPSDEQSFASLGDGTLTKIDAFTRIDTPSPPTLTTLLSSKLLSRTNASASSSATTTSACTCDTPYGIHEFQGFLIGLVVTLFVVFLSGMAITFAYKKRWFCGQRGSGLTPKVTRETIRSGEILHLYTEDEAETMMEYQEQRLREKEAQIAGTTQEVVHVEKSRKRPDLAVGIDNNMPLKPMPQAYPPAPVTARQTDYQPVRVDSGRTANTNTTQTDRGRSSGTYAPLAGRYEESPSAKSNFSVDSFRSTTYGSRPGSAFGQHGHYKNSGSTHSTHSTHR